jgi:Dual specificity phosphatase, catalytic domain
LAGIAMKTKRHFFRGILLVGILVGFWLVALALLARIERSYEPDNYTLIEDGLFLGGSVKKPPRGTEAVLNLCETEDCYRTTFYVWQPLKDGGPAPDLDSLREMVEFIDSNRQQGRITFVHCLAGVNRSGLVVVAYEMYEHRWTRDQALEFVRTKRPQVRPIAAFMELLEQWEIEVQRQ